MAGALIVSAELGAEDQAWFDRLRRAHYPPDRNRLPAHLTMFHALPPSAESEARAALARLSAERRPVASVEGLMNLGNGVAFRIVSPDLNRMRADLAELFRGMLTAQDAGGWRPHVTVQNKVSATEARALLAILEKDFRPRRVAIKGLGLHRYLGGPWEALTSCPFRGA